MATTIVTITDGMAHFEDGTSVRCTVEQVRALPHLLKVLEHWAEPYVAKGIVEHAYDGCVVDGERALGYIDQVLVEAGVRQPSSPE